MTNLGGSNTQSHGSVIVALKLRHCRATAGHESTSGVLILCPEKEPVVADGHVQTTPSFGAYAVLQSAKNQPDNWISDGMHVTLLGICGPSVPIVFGINPVRFYIKTGRF